jgi:uncharacterized membrane protein YbhN (UPF0104 family)
LDHLRWAWVPLALGLEWVSISVFARMQRRLLAVGGATVAARPMLATVYAANAIATSLPLAGPELGAAFTYRRFKRQSVEPPVAGWTLMVGGVLSPLAGVFVLVAGALLSGNDEVAALGALGGVLGMAAIVLLHTAIRHPRLRHLGEWAAAGVLKRIRRLLRRPVGDPQDEIGVWAERLASLRPDASVWTGASILALANWLADAGVLAVSIYAVDATVPWQALLLVTGLCPHTKPRYHTGRNRIGRGNPVSRPGLCRGPCRFGAGIGPALPVRQFPDGDGCRVGGSPVLTPRSKYRSGHGRQSDANEPTLSGGLR